MRLRIAEGQEAGRVLTLRPEGFGIGRGHDNDLLIGEEGISRHHCRLSLADGTWRAEDLNSMNGVSVNGHRIVGSCALAPGDRLGIGRHILVIEEGDAEPAAPPRTAAAPAPAAPAPAPALDLAGPPVTQVEPLVPAAPAARAEPLWDENDLPPRRRFPWVRLALLVVLLGVISTLAFLVFSRSGTSTAPAAVAPPGGSDGRASPPKEVSDAELSRLIDDEQKTPTAAGGAKPAGRAAAGAPASGAAAGGAEAAEERPAAEAGRAVVSDLVFVASEPSGATVTVDGQEKGKAPLLLRGLEKGRHRIVLSLDGYEEFDRQIHVPDLLPSRPYALRPKAGTLYATSTAPGTAVWRGPQLLGVAPALIQGLPADEHDLVFSAPGCEPLRRAVTVSEVSSTRADVDPKPMLGILEISTQPAGCTVSVEGTLKGVTAAAGEPLATTSAVLRFAGLRAGTYTVVVEHPLGVSRSGKLTVKAGETVTQAVRLWIPDTRLVLADGSVKTGMIVERNEPGDIVLAETARQLERYLKPQVAKLAPLSKEEAVDLLRKQGALGSARAPEGKTEEKGENKDTPRDAGDRHGGDTKGDAEKAAGIAWGDEPPAAARPDRPPAAADASDFTVDELTELLHKESSTEVTHRLKDRRVTLRGRGGKIGKDGVDSYVYFGRRIRCYLDREATGEGDKERLRAATGVDEMLTITGVSAGFRGDVLVLRDCKAEVVGTDARK